MKLLVLRVTLRALASSSPGLRQPWGPKYQRIVTLKALANGCAGDFATLLEFAKVWVGNWNPRVAPTLGWN